MRTAYTAAPAFMATFITDVHADFLPFVHFRRAENRTNLVRAARHAHLGIHHKKMRLRIRVKPLQILLLLNAGRFRVR
jgi:hypothetical protein